MTVSEAVAYYQEQTPRGEYVLIVEGADENTKQKEQPWMAWTVREHVDHLIQTGLSQKDAIKEAAKERGVPKREVYQAYHIEE